MELKPVDVYAQEIKQKLIALKGENVDAVAASFAKFDISQTESIDKSDLAIVLETAGIKVSKKKARELSITLETRLHGEVCLDELNSLVSALISGNIDTKLLKRADHQLPKGHINIGQMVPQNQVKLAPSNSTNMKKVPSCELLDQLDEIPDGILLYKLDEYGSKLFKSLESTSISEEDRVTIAEAFSEVDEAQTGRLPVAKLDALFRACRRELPGFELREIQEKHGSPEVTFEQFSEMYVARKSADVGNTFKSSIKGAVGVVNKKNNVQEVEKEETQRYNASHSYSLAERRAFSSWINQNLINDPDCKAHLPINVESEDLFQALEDGVVLCKAINCAKPDTIDERVMNKKNFNIFKKHENVLLGLNSAAQSLGCKIVNIRPDDITVGVPHLILGLLWQIIRHGLLKNISLSKNVNIMALLRPGETLADLENLSPENVLIRWMNHHLSKAESDQGTILNAVNNFGSDMADSTVYINLLNQLGGANMKHLGAKAIKIKDNLARAVEMLKMAEQLDIKPIITPQDVVAGDEKLNMAFLATLFNKHNGLDKNDLPEEILANLDVENLEEMLDEMEETREEETFRNWVNSLDIKTVSKSMASNVNNLYYDLRDGLYLLKIEDEIRPGVVSWNRVHKSYDKWQRHMKCMENCSYAVEIGQNKLSYSLVGINGANIYEMDRTRTLAILWQLMRSYMTKVLSTMNGEVGDAEIQRWCNKTLEEHGKSSRVGSFKDKNLAGAVIDLCDVLSPGSADYSMVNKGTPPTTLGKDEWLSPEHRLENAQLAINLCRKIGAKVYASPMDLVEGKQKMILTVFVGLMSKSFESANPVMTVL